MAGKFDGAIRLPGAKHVQRGVDSGPPQITFFVIERVFVRSGAALASEQAQKYRLRGILGVRSVAGDSVRGAEHQAVIRLERLDRIPVGIRDRPFLRQCQCALQGTPPVVLSSQLKTVPGRYELLQAHPRIIFGAESCEL